MTRDAAFKRRVRARMAGTGEAYSTARAHLDEHSTVRELHITNGDSAARALKQGGIGGPVIAWRDVLHVGPVPTLPSRELAAVRARFLAESFGGEPASIERELLRRDAALQRAVPTRVVLWFDADLYDQLQLIQVLDRLAAVGARDVTLVSIGEFTGRSHFAGLGDLAASDLVALRKAAGQAVGSDDSMSPWAHGRRSPEMIHFTCCHSWVCAPRCFVISAKQSSACSRNIRGPVMVSRLPSGACFEQWGQEAAGALMHSRVFGSWKGGRFLGTVFVSTSCTTWHRPASFEGSRTTSRSLTAAATFSGERRIWGGSGWIGGSAELTSLLHRPGAGTHAAKRSSPASPELNCAQNEQPNAPEIGRDFRGRGRKLSKRASCALLPDAGHTRRG